MISSIKIHLNFLHMAPLNIGFLSYFVEHHTFHDLVYTIHGIISIVFLLRHYQE